MQWDLVLDMDVSFNERIKMVASMLHTMESVEHVPDQKEVCIPVSSKNQGTARESGYCASRLQTTIHQNYLSFRGSASLGTVTNGDLLDVWVSHSLSRHLPISIVFDGQVLTAEQYVYASFQPFRMWFRPWVTVGHVCGEDALDEETHKGLLAHSQNLPMAEVNLTNQSSIELCSARHWVMVLFHNEDDGHPYAFYMHLSFAVRQVLIELSGTTSSL